MKANFGSRLARLVADIRRRRGRDGATGALDAAQRIERELTAAEREFMNTDVIPKLDKTQDDRVLKDLSDTYWNLCQWEKQRADILDTKAGSLLGFASIAAAVLAAGAVGASHALDAIAIARMLSLLLFASAVALAIVALAVQQYGTFVDRDVFDATLSHEAPVGEITPFADKDPYRCYLREMTLQRWLIYRWYGEQNDEKAQWLKRAQYVALGAVLSLVIPLILVWITA
jgi:hypothetical protein